MAFDLSTATPVSSGFDLSTAKPVQDMGGSWDDSKSLDAKIGMATDAGNPNAADVLSNLKKVGGNIGRNIKQDGIGVLYGLANTVEGIPQVILNSADWLNKKIPGYNKNGFGSTLLSKAATGYNRFLDAQEGDYQAATPNGSGLGRFVGNVAPMVATLGAADAPNMIVGGGNLLKQAASRGGLTGSVPQWIAGKAGNAIGGSTLGAMSSAATPVYDANTSQDYVDKKSDQIKTGAIVSGVLPAAGDLAASTGKYIGGTLSAIKAPFTESGINDIADNVVNKFARGGPTSLNSSEIVPGSIPTLAQATANPGIAKMENTVRDLNPNIFGEREAANNQARLDLFNQHAGDTKTLAALETARDDAALPFKNQAFANQKPVVPTNALSAIDDIMSAPGKGRDAVKSVMSNIREKLVAGETLPNNPAAALVSENGSPLIPSPQKQNTAPEQNPEYLYETVRKQIGDLLDKRAAVQNPAAQIASKELLQVKAALDKDITSGASGFDKYLKEYSEGSKPIDAQNYLQNLNLTTPNGNITLAKVQGALDKIDRLQRAPGANEAKNLHPDQIKALTAIRDDLLRESNSNLVKSRGSNTFQNFGTANLMESAIPGALGRMAGKISPEALGASTGGLLGYLAGSPFYGAAIGGGAGRGLSALMRGSDEKVKEQILQRLINPELGGAALNGEGTLPAQSTYNALKQRFSPYLLPSATIGTTNTFNQP